MASLRMPCTTENLRNLGSSVLHTTMVPGSVSPPFCTLHYYPTDFWGPQCSADIKYCFSLLVMGLYLQFCENV